MTKLFSWNVNGIRSVINKGEFQKFLKNYQPDIICLQETKANQEQVEIDLPNYFEFWNSAEKKGYSGTAIFSKKEPIKVINGIPGNITKKYQLVDSEDRDSSTEGRVMTAEFAKFYVVTVYTPNSKDDLSRIPLRHKHWDPAFLEHCALLNKKKPVLVCGDFNVAYTPDDLARPGPNEGKKGYTAEEREGLGNFIKAGFIDSLRLFKSGNGYYTWWTHWGNARANNVGWRIDYWLASKSLKSKIKSADIHPEQVGSDHCPVSIVLDI
ncbi:exodeoxyribonuclease III [Candidatus Saccharibacteria bacterium]|nr:exodeoxyribonuclease III [Candidatus Saccharibacteria bacterium]